VTSQLEEYASAIVLSPHYFGCTEYALFLLFFGVKLCAFSVLTCSDRYLKTIEQTQALHRKYKVRALDLGTESVITDIPSNDKTTIWLAQVAMFIKKKSKYISYKAMVLPTRPFKEDVYRKVCKAYNKYIQNVKKLKEIDQ
jgi:hypothetical protein